MDKAEYEKLAVSAALSRRCDFDKEIMGLSSGGIAVIVSLSASQILSGIWAVLSVCAFLTAIILELIILKYDAYLIEKVVNARMANPLNASESFPPSSISA